ncbi:MAG TPA: hypothetical protein PK530_18835 [Anaerolineales bacterium]|nr:hypothetical protein [Anaerolineales bacterium]
MNQLRIFFLTFGLASLGLILYGLIGLAFPVNSMSISFGVIYLYPYDLLLTRFLTAVFRLLAFYSLILGGVGSVLLWQYRKHKQPWMAYTVIGMTILAYLGLIIFTDAFKAVELYEVMAHILFLLMLISGISMWKGAKEAEFGWF